MKVIPTFDKVHLTEDSKSNTSVTASGIVVEGRNSDSQTYTVAAVGEEVKSIKVGDKALIKLDESVYVVKFEGRQSVIVPENKILAILK